MAHTIQPLPQIKPRNALRRWADRVIVRCIRYVESGAIKEATYWRFSKLPSVLYWSPFWIAIGSCLIGVMFPSPLILIGLGLSVLSWPVRWAMGPWADDSDVYNVHALLTNHYQLLQDFSAIDQMDAIVEWALQDPNFDTRHLSAIMYQSGDFPEEPGWFRRRVFVGSNALDLFDGEVGRRVRAIQQGQQLDAMAPSGLGVEACRRL